MVALAIGSGAVDDQWHGGSALQYMGRACRPLHNITTFLSEEAVAIALGGIINNSVETFTHIPRMGGTAWSWHLRATHTEPGLIAPGSTDSGAFDLHPEMVLNGEEKNREAKVFFGHSRFPAVLRRVGATSSTWHSTTFLRDAREHALASGCRQPKVGAGVSLELQNFPRKRCGDEFMNTPRRDAIAHAFRQACNRCNAKISAMNESSSSPLRVNDDAYKSSCESAIEACDSMWKWAGGEFNPRLSQHPEDRRGRRRLGPGRHFGVSSVRRHEFHSSSWLHWLQEDETTIPSVDDSRDDVACVLLASAQRVRLELLFEMSGWFGASLSMTLRFYLS